MSYAVIQTGGKQYKVKSGEIVKIEKLQKLKPISAFIPKIITFFIS